MTGIPLIPLKRLVDPSSPITYGIVQAGEDVEGGVPYIRPVDMKPFARDLDPAGLRTTAPEIAQTYSRSRVRAGDLVVSIGPSYGKLLLVPSRLTGANLTQGTARVSPSASVDGRFLQWALFSGAARGYWASVTGGATFGGLNLRPLSETPVPQMELQAQKEIADFLDFEGDRIARLAPLGEQSGDGLLGRYAALLTEYRDALIAEAMNGKLDVTRLSERQLDESAHAAMEGERPEVLSA